MDFDLSQEQQGVLDLARQFAEGEVAPGAQERDRTGEFPRHLFRRMGELGFLGLPLPEEYGGSGADTVSYVLAVEQVSRADAGVGLSYAAHVSIGIGPVYYFGSEEQKLRWLPGAARGEYLASFGLTEPEAGSDAAGTRTTAVADGDGWVINGEKCYITNGGYAGYIVITARTDRSKDHKGITAFICPTSTPGFSAGEPYAKMGLHSSDTRPLYFSDLRLGREHLLGQEGEGFRQFMATLDGGRISIAAFALGIAQAALDQALAHAKQRVQFGQPIARFQAIQFKLADMATEIEAARTLTLKAAWLKDQHRPFGKEAAMAKLLASEVAERAASACVQIHGGYGYMTEAGVERLMRDAKLATIGEGTSEIQRMVIARLLGC